ncbi:hypothetical protein AS149_25545 [Burkholderia cenocepacia]|nr:hypothetical protein AS149_25545 [Burkholderia cenocepacia]
MLPVFAPMTVGVKMTLMVQLAAGARLVAHVLLDTANGPITFGVPRTATLPPEFVSVTANGGD